MMLAVEFAVRSRGVEVSFDLPDRQTLLLTGPNGSGKSTTLEVIAGLLRPDTGHVRLGDRTLVGPRRWVPAHNRHVALLAQRPLLFPHLSVAGNVAFGPRSQGMTRRSSRDLAMGWLERVGAAEFAARRPDQLSGGEAQRVALARALATEPRVLLLDEPLAALDAESAPQLRALLRTVLRDRTTVLVSHDQDDIAGLADMVVELGRPG